MAVEWKYHFFDWNKVLQERERRDTMNVDICWHDDEYGIAFDND